MKNIFRSLFASFVFGVLLGGCMSAWLAPRIISWWYNPPAQVPFNCTPAIQWALDRLQLCQLWASIAGGILFVIFWALFRMNGSQRTKAEPTKL